MREKSGVSERGNNQLTHGIELCHIHLSGFKIYAVYQSAIAVHYIYKNVRLCLLNIPVILVM